MTFGFSLVGWWEWEWRSVNWDSNVAGHVDMVYVWGRKKEQKYVGIYMAVGHVYLSASQTLQSHDID